MSPIKTPLLTLAACASLALSASFTHAQDQWTTAHLAPAAGLSTRMCFHEADGRIVAVSPRQDKTELETWEWDGTRWQHRITPSPDVYQGFEMVYDAARKVAVLFGGIHANGQYLNEIWEWNGVRWTKRSPTVTPSPRASMSLAYDAARQRVVMYGGDSRNGRESDLWEWDGASWTLRPSMSPNPGARAGGMMTFDTRRGVVVLFGGIGPLPYFLDDTWEFDGQQWTRRNPTVQPPASRGYSMTYDSRRSRSILYGGDLLAPQTWEWDGSNWAGRTTAATPGPRLSTGLAFDPLRNNVLLHAGQYSTDTWIFEPVAGTWSKLPYQTPRPTASSLAIFNGIDRTLYFDAVKTLEWNHSLRSWRIVPSALQPSVFLRPSLAFDTTRRQGVLFGALRSGGPETWIWDEATTAWQLRSPTTSPPPIQETRMAFDPVRGRTVLFGGLLGGLPQNDTYEWDGTNWARMNPATSPPARFGGTMAFDPLSNRVTLFGGSDILQRLGDVWDWDGSNWTQRSVSIPGPTPRQSAVMVSRNDGLILVAGLDDSGPLDDVWALRGSNWVRLPSGIPTLVDPHVTLDTNRDELTVFGGRSTGLVPTQPFFTTGVWVYGIPQAAAQTIGSGCAGSRGRPQLAGRGLPFLGNANYGFDMSNLPVNQLAALTVSPSLKLLELPNGCRIYLENPALVRLTPASATGTVGWSLPVPTLPSLVGIELFVQGAAADPAGPGLVVTQALQLRVGR